MFRSCVPLLHSISSFLACLILILCRYVNSGTVICIVPENEDAVITFYPVFPGNTTMTDERKITALPHMDPDFSSCSYTRYVNLCLWQLSELLTLEVAIDGQAYTNDKVRTCTCTCFDCLYSIFVLLLLFCIIRIAVLNSTRYISQSPGFGIVLRISKI